ncbi:hypothetical protein [Falsirhodobacter deserti]|uniref:hypothetical protein n=1 Tax=Falsirhodobacter deserti TaxID=1365611 RepID=UPI000FE2F205|nr:hypothetical protein [Falsirhodobacter deserti]
MKDAEVTALFQRCRHHLDPEAFAGEVLRAAIDYTDEVVRPLEGLVIAADGSNYEASISNGFPSARMGLLKIGQVGIDIAEYHKIDPRSGGTPDPITIAKIEREKNTYSVPLTGAGIHLDGHGPRESFRKSTFEAFRSKRFELLGGKLETTLVDLFAIDGATEAVNGRRHLKLPSTMSCPITGERFGHDVLVPEDIGEVPSPHAPDSPLYLTDILRLSEAFAEEGTNQQAYTRAMSALEHLVLAHTIMRLDADEHTRAILNGAIFLVDGPLGIFGEPAKLHRPMMKMINDVRSRVVGLPPLVMGVTKSGRVVEHGKLIQPLLLEHFPRGRTVLIPVSDEYRYRYIDFGAKNPEKNFGNDTYYGQSFLVRSVSDRIFELNIAYPFAEKGAGFQDRKVDLSAYGADIGRAIGVVELFETELYADANIVQHLAHRCASISHRPAGRTLDMFVRSIIGA